MKQARHGSSYSSYVFMTDDKTLHLYKSIYIFSGGKKEENFHRSKKKGNLKKK